MKNATPQSKGSTLMKKNFVNLLKNKEKYQVMAAGGDILPSGVPEEMPDVFGSFIKEHAE